MHRFRLTAPNISSALARTMAVSILVVGLGSSLTARAAELDPDEESSSWGLGLGIASSQQPYTDIDRDNEVIPLIYFENDYVQIFGPNAEIKLPSLHISDSQQFNFNVVAEYDFSGYEEGDARILDGMDDRDGGFWAGANVGWQNELVNVNAEWLADVSGDSDGQRFTLGLERSWEFGDHMMLAPRLAAIWQDKEYVDYYFGVRSDEVRFDRAAYEGKSTINTEFGVRGTYMFDKQQSVFLDVEAVRFGSEIEDSPLVDTSSENSVRFGYLYRF
ncbi:MipA/OmpV family protein [Stutzerimonas sp. VN223-3]|uniref:MipA/OmpV family protein n=1 Tax=Stutzerimonas sp. VN223-3 TaxID=3384601 RepID=UPI0038B592FD